MTAGGNAGGAAPQAGPGAAQARRASGGDIFTKKKRRSVRGRG
jgi:hypothetical protein